MGTRGKLRSACFWTNTEDQVIDQLGDGGVLADDDETKQKSVTLNGNRNRILPQPAKSRGLSCGVGESNYFPKLTSKGGEIVTKRHFLEEGETS